MPQDNPQFGELWVLRGERPSNGYIANITPTLITFVSLVGHRASIPSTRLGSWQYLSTPQTQAHCQRPSCSAPGIFRYLQGDDFHCVCPRHLPRGIVAEQTPSEDTTRRKDLPETNCINCESDAAVEDLSQFVQQRFGPLLIWACTICNEKWAILQLPAGSDVRVACRGVREQLQLIELRTRRIEVHPSHVDDPSPLEDDVVLHANVSIEPSIVRFRFGSLPTPRRTVQRLGGQPNRTMGLPSRSIPIEESKEEPELLVAVQIGSLWTRKGLGGLVEVVRIDETEGGRVVIVKSRGNESSAVDPSMPVLWEDFQNLHRRFVPNQVAPITPFQISVLEEWQSTNGAIITITSVDNRRDEVLGSFADGKSVRVPLDDFIAGRWSKIIRPSVYDFILNDDDSL